MIHVIIWRDCKQRDAIATRSSSLASVPVTCVSCPPLAPPSSQFTLPFSSIAGPKVSSSGRPVLCSDGSGRLPGTGFHQSPIGFPVRWAAGIALLPTVLCHRPTAVGLVCPSGMEAAASTIGLATTQHDDKRGIGSSLQLRGLRCHAGVSKNQAD
ncbi:unnamed protein product [Protopolystoma xenopodis]|uniref:Uncharacterized protein n=1 Tax=Protopolystoma xenopodis TaxID=117903 RepID=A0A448WVC2_9PLAT|nr:unnamed protein product [Protopolystoma xenopodis]